MNFTKFVEISAFESTNKDEEQRTEVNGFMIFQEDDYLSVMQLDACFCFLIDKMTVTI